MSKEGSGLLLLKEAINKREINTRKKEKRKKKKKIVNF